MFVYEIIVLALVFFFFGVYFGRTIAKGKGPQIELPGWVQTIRDVFGF